MVLRARTRVSFVYSNCQLQYTEYLCPKPTQHPHFISRNPGLATLMPRDACEVAKLERVNYEIFVTAVAHLRQLARWVIT